jgi:hypothetical protein
MLRAAAFAAIAALSPVAQRSAASLPLPRRENAAS